MVRSSKIIGYGEKAATDSMHICSNMHICIRKRIQHYNPPNLYRTLSVIDELGDDMMLRVCDISGFVFIAVLIGIILSIRKKRNILVLILMLCLILSSCLLVFIRGENRSYNIRYTISIETNRFTKYEIIVPIALDYNSSSHKIMDHIKIENGNANWIIENTIHGLGLRIKGIGDVSITGEMNDRKATFFEKPLRIPSSLSLSMKNNSDDKFEYFWTYFDIPVNSTLHMDLECSFRESHSSGSLITIPWDANGGGPDYYLDPEINENGWQLFQMRQVPLIIY